MIFTNVRPRFIGYNHFWYDGPNFEFGFYYFYIYFTGYKDHERWLSKRRLRDFCSILFDKKFNR